MWPCCRSLYAAAADGRPRSGPRPTIAGSWPVCWPCMNLARRDAGGKEFLLLHRAHFINESSILALSIGGSLRSIARWADAKIDCVRQRNSMSKNDLTTKSRALTARLEVPEEGEREKGVMSCRDGSRQ